MKQFAIATFGVLLATVPAARAADTSCTGSSTGVTINGNLVVPNGASCTLANSTVTGNMQVGTGASLFIQDSVTIGGNIKADHCNRIFLRNPFGNIFVGGNIQIQYCTDSGYSSGAEPIKISGNFKCDNNLGCDSEFGSIGGNVQVNNNSGVPSVVSRNTIGGNLQCAGNTPSVTDSGGANTVAGKKQGQCAGL